MKTFPSILKTLTAVLTAVLCIVKAAAAESAQDSVRERPPRILMLSSFNSSYVQYFLESSACLNALNGSGRSYVVDRFGLERPHSPYASEKLAELNILLERMRSGYYQVVLVFYGPILEMIKKDLPNIPESVKIISCGLPPSLADRLPKARNLYYLFQDFQLGKNIQLIRSLFPERKKIILLTHWNRAGEELRAQMAREIRKYPEMTLFAPDNETCSPAEVLKYIVELNQKDAVVIYFAWFNYSAVNAASLQFLMDTLGNNPDLPLLVLHSSLLRYGTVGGYMEDAAFYGEQAAKLTLSLIDGEEVPREATVPASLILNQPMLEFYRIPASRIPEDAVVLGQDQQRTFFQMYRKTLITLLSVLTGGLLGCSVLLYFIFRFRRLSRQIGDVFRNLPLRVMVVDAQENVLLQHTGHPLGRIPKMRDFWPDQYGFMQEILSEVLRTGKSRTEEYILDGRHQRGSFIYLPEQIFGRPAMLSVGIDVDELYYLNQNEMIQMECLRTVLPEFNSNASFAAILKIFCEHLHGDRCYLVHYDLQNQNSRFVEEYCAPGIPTLQGDFPAQPPEEIMDWINRNQTRASKDHKQEYYRVSELPDSPLARHLHLRGVKELYIMPIFLKNELWGSFGLVYKQRLSHLSDVQKQIFPMIAKMIELILLRQSYISDISEARDAALAAAQAKSTFLATMSHELRTPLNAVIGFSELLSEESLSPRECREYISSINYAGKSLLGLINNILDYSKLESEQMKIVAAPTDFNELLNKLKAVLRQPAEAKGLELNVLCPPLPRLLLDAYRVKQILTNLISNAIKFTEKGRILVQVSYESGTLKTAVSDTGRGIDKDFQQKIFEPFYQRENSDATRAGGTGLGLMISRKLAEQMHGCIQLVSEPGSGSTFTLVLPDVPAVTETAGSATRELPDMTGCLDMDILIVDDSPINLKVLEAMFRKIQLPVRKASSGAAALEAMKEKAADVIFTDLRMPEMSGSELAQIIRRNPAWNKVRVVAITADIMFDKEQKAVFDDVLLKPISLEQLFTVLRKISNYIK